jgi:Zn-finger nucleic acid-binding protein
MNCPNCGAAMELVESRRHFRCRHCGTFGFPRPVDADGIRTVGPVPDAPACPVCAKPLKAAVLDEDHPIHLCAVCRGVLLPRATFATVIGKRRAWATGPPAEPAPMDRRALARELTCPSCRGRFDTYPHYGPGNVVIDSCTRCDLIWLDFGEMQDLVDAPGRDRGSKHVPRIDESYVRQGAWSREEEEPDHEEPLTTLFRFLFRR